MEDEWTTVGKRNKTPVPAPRKQYSEEFVQDVRANKVYAKREFPAGVTVSKPLEPMVSKGGSVFSSRLRQEVEQARVTPIPTNDVRNTIDFETTKVVKPSPYKNAALNAVKQEKVRQANAAVAASRSSDFTTLQNIPIIRMKRSAAPILMDEYDLQPSDGGFDNSDPIRTRRVRVQPTEKFQTVTRVSHVTAVKSAIDIIEPEEDTQPDNSTEQPDYESGNFNT